MTKTTLSERDICSKFITPAITGAGWDLHAQIREEVSFTKGRIIVRGNPNLLWDQDAEGLAVIDHNQAFDADFDPLRFSQAHVFHQDFPAVFDDMVERMAYQARLTGAIAEYDRACDTAPTEWWWVDHGVPTDLDRNAARATLERYLSNDFWRIA